MNTAQALKVSAIVKDAETRRKGDYRAYETLKQRIVKLNLRSDEYERVVRQVAKALSI